MLAICVKDTKHNKVGDILDLGDKDHPFIVSGDFELIVTKKVVKKVKKVKSTKKGRK
jgi:hypothetical protein